MKDFAIIQCRGGVHIRYTPKNRPPQQVIIGEADTYEDAVILRDQQRIALEENKSKNTDQWHDKWRKAEASGNIDELNRLSGIRY